MPAVRRVHRGNRCRRQTWYLASRSSGCPGVPRSRSSPDAGWHSKTDTGPLGCHRSSLGRSLLGASSSSLLLWIPSDILACSAQMHQARRGHAVTITVMCSSIPPPRVASLVPCLSSSLPLSLYHQIMTIPRVVGVGVTPHILRHLPILAPHTFSMEISSTAWKEKQLCTVMTWIR